MKEDVSLLDSEINIYEVCCANIDVFVSLSSFGIKLGVSLSAHAGKFSVPTHRCI